MTRNEAIFCISNLDGFNRLEYCAECAEEARLDGDEALLNRYRGKIRGYLYCLHDMGIITAVERAQLYAYFTVNWKNED